MRFCLPAVVLALGMSAPVFAGETSLKGSWKLTFYLNTDPIPFWLLHFGTAKDGKPTVIASSLRNGPKSTTVKEIKIVGDTIHLEFAAVIIPSPGSAPQDVAYHYEGKLPKAGATKMFGSLTQGNRTVPAVLDATTATSAFELERDLVKRAPGDPKALAAVFDLIRDARKNKVAGKDLQEWVDASFEGSARYGPRYQVFHGMNLVDALYSQRIYIAASTEMARKVVKQLDPKSPAATQMSMLAAVAEVLRAGGEKREAAALEARVEGLEDVAFADYSKTALNFKVEKFAGRKTNSDRAVLVELFTGVHCSLCVAPDLAFDGLEKTYPSRDVVLLQYHTHSPSTDPLSCPESEARFDYYAETYKKQIGTPPTVLFDGKPIVPKGGYKDDAPKKFSEYCEVVNNLLELPATVQLSAQAIRVGDKIAIQAKVNDLSKPGDKIRLRLVLVEDWVRFRGANGTQYHHRVVRAMPGGARGTTLKAKDFARTAEVDLADLRKDLGAFLDNPYTPGSRPMRMRDLRVIAFVQNDDTAEVLNAVDVPVVVKK